RLGTLDPEDLDARMRASQLAAEMGDMATAVREYKDISARLQKQDKHADALVPLQMAYDLDKSDEGSRSSLFTAYLASNPAAARGVAKGAEELKQIAAMFEKAGDTDALLDVLGAVAESDPSDLEVRAGLAQAYVARGELDKARSYLSAETASANPALWLTLAEMELRADRLAE